jgi:hypothetical protein
MRTRLLLPILLLALAPLALLTTAGAAEKDHERAIGARLVLDTQPFMDGEAERCAYAVFVEFPEVKGAVSYRVVVQDKDPRVNVTRTLVGPPFNDDVEDYKAPSGSHRFGGLTGGAGPAPCPALGDFSGRFEIKEAVAVLDGKRRIAGTVKDADGKGVGGVSISVGGERTTTGADGTYSQVVKQGRHTVSAGRGYCATGGGSTCERSRTVEVREGTKTVDFAAETHTLAGRIRKVCGGVCPSNPGIGGVTVTASAAGGKAFTATTDDAGRYRVKAPAGTYVVHPALDGFRFDPDQRRVRLDDDEDRVDFDGCGATPVAIMAQAPGAYRSAQRPSDDDACGEHEFSAKIEKGFVKIAWHGPTECGTFAQPYYVSPDLPAVKITPGVFQTVLVKRGDPGPIGVTFRVDVAPDGTTTIVIRNAEAHTTYVGRACASSFNRARDPAKVVTLAR